MMENEHYKSLIIIKMIINHIVLVWYVYRRMLQLKRPTLPYLFSNFKYFCTVLSSLKRAQIFSVLCWDMSNRFGVNRPKEP